MKHKDTRRGTELKFYNFSAILNIVQRFWMLNNNRKLKRRQWNFYTGLPVHLTVLGKNKDIRDDDDSGLYLTPRPAVQ